MPADRPVPHNRWDLLPEPGPTSRDVSVVVTHYRQPAQLERTLHALAHQSLRPREIVIGDDGSEVPPAPAPSAIPTHVVAQPDLGFRAAAARNLAARRCRGEILVFLDADTTPERDFVDVLTRRVALCRDVLAVGRRRHAALDGLPPDADPAGAPELPEPAWLAEGYRSTANLLAADGRSFRFVISAVMACRRALFEDLGGFDERFVGYGGEDWDLGYRAWNAGAVLVHEPGAVAWHDGPEWAGRPGHSTADLQSARLAALIPEPSTRGAALPAAVPDVVAEVAGGMDLAATVRCVHSLLRQDFRDLRVGLGPDAAPAAVELYGPNVQRRPWTAEQLARCRARLLVRSPIPAGALGRAMDLLVGRDRGVVEIVCDGRPAATLTSTRAIGRARRWSDDTTGGRSVDALFGTGRVEVGPPPLRRDDLAGYFALR